MNLSQTREEEQVCSMCAAEPEDMLILSCKHNLCLECATEVYHLNSSNNSQNCIHCQICLAQTKLDEETITCLRTLLAKSYKSKIQDGSRFEDQEDIKKLNLPKAQSNKKATLSPQQMDLYVYEAQEGSLVCKKHKEPLLYFCLDCNTYKICSECMLAENHREHRVSTLKKASFALKEEIQNFNRQKNRLKSMLLKDKEQLLSRRKISERQHNSNCAELKEVFDEIFKVVSQKYQELKEALEENAVRKLEIMDGAINEITDKMMLIEQTISFQEQLLEETFKNNNKELFKVFDYYINEMSSQKINFEPVLPEFIPEVPHLYLERKNLVEKISSKLQIIRFCQNHEELGSENLNINCISGIQDNSNVFVDQDLQIAKLKARKQESPKFQFPSFNREVKALSNAGEKINSAANIKIIEKNKKYTQNKGFSNNTSKMTQNTLHQPKAISRQKEVNRIKSQLRQKLQGNNYRELACSRKLQLSRSLVNAAEIINKIQQRNQL